MSILSIVIPMFNEQENIEECIKVLKQQTNQKFNVIFVDDGSTDCTQKLLKKYLADDIEFKYSIIEQNNKGAAEARRAGTKKSETDYILFFDCDDVLSNNMVDEVYRTYNENKDVDMIIPDMSIQKKSKEWESFIFYTKDKLLSSSDCLLASIGGWQIHGCFTVRKEIILKSYGDYSKYNKNNINYVNNDEVITRLNFSNSKKIIRCNGVYYYNYNDLSTTKKLNDQRYLMIKNASILYNLYSNNAQIQSSVSSEFVSVLWGSFRYMHQYKKEINNIKDWKKTIKEYVNHFNYFTIFSNIDFKKRVQLTILKLINIF